MSDQQLEPQARQEILPAAPAFASDGPPVPHPAPALESRPQPGTVLAAATLPAAVPEPPAPCTQAQLRRFIKSRPYVPLHELRRRFGLDGADDDVTGVEVDGHRIFIGLPVRETGLLGELLRQGDVGYELLLDPTSPLVIGVFPMRPVQRP